MVWRGEPRWGLAGPGGASKSACAWQSGTALSARAATHHHPSSAPLPPSPLPTRTPGPKCRDVVVTLDATPESATFGSILSVSPIPNWGTEPHHVGLVANGSVLAVGGIQAYLRGAPDINLFNVTSPARPRWLTAVDPPLVGERGGGGGAQGAVGGWRQGRPDSQRTQPPLWPVECFRPAHAWAAHVALQPADADSSIARSCP